MCLKIEGAVTSGYHDLDSSRPGSALARLSRSYNWVVKGVYLVPVT